MEYGIGIRLRGASFGTTVYSRSTEWRVSRSRAPIRRAWNCCIRKIDRGQNKKNKTKLTTAEKQKKKKEKQAKK